MLFSLSAAVSIQTRYLSKRGNVYYFVMRVPSHLIEKFGKDRIRESLQTSDPREAIREADARAKNYKLQFKTLEEDTQLTPIEVSKAAAQMVEKWGSLDHFIDFVVEPKQIGRAHV